MSKGAKPSKRQSNPILRVALSCRAPDATAVFVAGTFNGWKPGEMSLKRNDAGQWSVDLDPAPGRYEFKCIVDGRWCCESGCESENRGCPKCVPNDQGTMNRVLDVA